MTDLCAEALAALQAAGLPFETLEPDTGFRRHPSREYSRLWYIANSGTGRSGRPYLQVSAGDPRVSGGVETASFSWASWKDSARGNGLDHEELAEIRADIEAKTLAAKARRERELEEGAVRARWLWASAGDASQHPYLSVKRVAAHGLRMADGLLLVPVRDAAGELHGLQRIGPDGAKRFTPGSAIAGHFHLIGEPSEGKPLYLAEGYATGATVHEATGAPVAVAFNCGNLAPVAKALRDAYPQARLIVAGDNDAWTEGNPGMAHAKEAAEAVGAALVLPRFNGLDQADRPTDFNDLARLGGPEAVRAQLDPAIAPPRAIAPPTPAQSVATEEELAAAALHPRCIVENHTYADVAVVAAAGATGKSTLMLYEAIHVALGRPLYGLHVVSPGWTLYVAAEDRREQILARLREIMRPLDLSAAERATVLRGVRIWDVTGEPVKLIRAADGNMVSTPLADEIVDAYRADPPDVVVFDPLVSFGASEEAVNTNEQGLVTAARRIVKGLDCCVRLVHHTGKVNARAGTLDQYSARGGSALSDGARMVTVLAPWTGTGEGGGPRPPQGCGDTEGSSVIQYARAKLSYCRPQPTLWIERSGFSFRAFSEPPRLSPSETRLAQADQLARYLASELAAGRYHTARSLESASVEMGMSRSQVRDALSRLRVDRRVEDAEMPSSLRLGARKTYLAIAPVPTAQ